MVICENCGDVLDESELKNERSYVSDYMGGCYETYSVCPCGGDVVDAKRCEVCGEYFSEDVLRDGVCEECLNEEMTVDNAIECGKCESARSEVFLNGFLAAVFSRDKIDAILTQELDRLINTSDENASYVIDKAIDWCKEDLSYFADWLKNSN